jgi:hypothetical protein
VNPGSPAAGPEPEFVAPDDDVVVTPSSPESAPELSPDEPQAAARAMSRISADFFTSSRVNEPPGAEAPGGRQRRFARTFVGLGLAALLMKKVLSPLSSHTAAKHR